MSTALIYNFAEIDNLAQRVTDLSDLDQDELLDEIGAEVESQIRRRLSEEKEAPDGTQWPRLVHKYKAKKAETSSGGLLEHSGAMIDSMQYQVHSGYVEAGSNLPYVAHHNFGGLDIGTGMPQREFLGLSQDNEADLMELVNDFLNDAMQGLQQ